MATPATAGDPATRGVRLPRAARRQHLLDVTAELIVAEGIDAVTMEGLASRAGVSKGLGYAYFDNRDDLLVALFQREMVAFDAKIASAVEAAGTGLEARIRAIFAVTIDQTAERGLLLGALLQAKLTDGPLEDVRQRRQRAVERWFVDLVSEEMALPRATAKAAVTILLGASSGALDVWINRRMHRVDIVELYTRMAMGALHALAVEGATP